MAIVYKVWLHIERYDTATGEGSDMDAPGSSLATYETYDAAYDAAMTASQVSAAAMPLGIVHDDSIEGGIADELERTITLRDEG